MMNIMIPALMQIFLSPQTGDAQEAIRLFKITYQSKTSSPAAKIEAIHGLSASPSAGRARVLGQILKYAPHSHQIEAARALARFQGILEATRIASKALQTEKNTALCIVLANTLGELRNPESLKTLHKLLNHKNFHVSQEIIRSVALFRSTSSVQLLITTLKKAEKLRGESAQKRVKALNIALYAITEQPMVDSQEWGKWWGSMDVKSRLK